MYRGAYFVHLLLAGYLLAGVVMTLAPGWVVAGKTQLVALVKPSVAPVAGENKRGAAQRVRRSGFILLALAAGLFLAMNLGYGLRQAPQAGGPAGNGAAGSLEARVERHLLPFVERGRYPGLAAIGFAGDARFFVGLGSTRPGELAPPGPDTIFEIGSLTKLFTGVLLARRVERGELALEQSVATLLFPGLQAHSADGWPSLGELVTHTSGLPRAIPCGSRVAQFVAGLRGRNPYQGCDLAPLPAAPARASCAPGKRDSGCGYAYSNYGFALLGLALARHAGQSYEDLVAGEVLRPLGMRDAAVRLVPEQRERLTPGYADYAVMGPFYGARPVAAWDMPDSVAAAGGLRASATDMMRFLEASSGRTESPLSSAIRRSQSILHPDPAAPDTGDGHDDTPAIGMAWFESRLHDDTAVLYHGGLTGGHAAYIAVTRDGRAGVVLLANAARDLGDAGSGVMDVLIGEGDGSGPAGGAGVPQRMQESLSSEEARS